VVLDGGRGELAGVAWRRRSSEEAVGEACRGRTSTCRHLHCSVRRSRPGEAVLRAGSFRGADLIPGPGRRTEGRRGGIEAAGAETGGWHRLLQVSRRGSEGPQVYGPRAQDHVATRTGGGEARGRADGEVLWAR